MSNSQSPNSNLALNNGAKLGNIAITDFFLAAMDNFATAAYFFPPNITVARFVDFEANFITIEKSTLVICFLNKD
ncbi:MAG TPA: hypothetical protein V6D13_14895 [Halomicronema sp.]